MKVIIIGPYPPPYGGISVHIKRIRKYLERKNINVVLYDEFKRFDNKSEKIISIDNYKKFIFKIPFLKTDLIHFHCINKKVRILLGFYKIFGLKIILSVHGQSIHDQLSKSNVFIRKLLIFSLKNIDMIICVNPSISEELLKLGFDKNKVVTIPAYINPIECKYDFENIPERVWKFVNKSKFLISANGWLRFYNNEDLYGIDMLIKLIHKLKVDGYEVNLFLALLGCDSQNKEEKIYYKKLKNEIIDYGLDPDSDIFIFEAKDTEFYPILKKSKLFLRPTNTDGYGVSIAEALYYKVPSIASNVCVRPEGTILFKVRDIEDLYSKTVDVIDNYKCYKEKLKDIKIEDNADKILNVYKKLVNL
ncbi:glycosyltransferase family 4 protein [Clostridium sp. WLY-B-L2]|uniref:Glycosyltransferase family 4 protein n=1 Tax=Clostridium aromativorans TaxID=2836848 RepID=A0ABS8N962_9CLOT|nr:glycosyltransferase family 4 protein [Clostridium aromativorans]MCC9296349.1 glycosyltransferase family 4 protein [Clostridium aromativorans]